MGYFKIMNEHNEENEDVSLAQREYQKLMSDNLNGDILQDRIISYKNKAPAAPEGEWFMQSMCENWAISFHLKWF